MRYLLDTHVFIWWSENSSRLNPKFKQMISHPDNSIYLSICSLWEMAIKASLRKLRLKSNFQDLPQLYDFEILPIKMDHLIHLIQLPYLHKDPFDRMLISQSKSESLTLLTSDPKVQAYFKN
ncbi:hypothetical protein A2634_02185 [Candidatus Amesbacteria bacterium RIFCSPHIGHO2_01_FULL_48_32]|uniref:PIN domain-containing protein n=1 Tax=Candidatus Amesbacteria bacterium RIFCSPLOWO2_01_FULL_48_25 TaxID=1797259 RepID=A0A1F4ZG21_9BACT|nr:MAG: hypothetical protein A2634_02185 [Candidatus Amesbacteria bacterium RIFCSPHIGHO2_01_FULL_48_32]OGD04394.1 MAG: hypothetical protein A2989_05185 [Candidatus Amesbacteria bacterium RIFCSPLOWO2_01_FULL_48_25]HJZ06234.1 type II toxin-antitoxin system VapC family toxin [Patescibacteria group bacterium]